MADLVHLLRHRNFRFLWLAHSASIIGNGLVITALAIYITQLTGDASDLGIVLAAAALPLVTFTLVGGVLADRLPRQKLMIATDLVRFALHTTLACLIFFGDPQIWQIVVIELLFGVAEAFFRPASTGLMPQTIPEEEIQQATSLMATMSNIAELGGPALATALVLGVSAGAAFALDAATFLLSAAFLTQVGTRTRGAMPEDVTERGSFWSEMREGLDEVRSRVWVWATLLAFSVALFCGLAPEFVLGPTIAKEQYGNIAVYGVFAASLGAGTIIGSVIGLRWRPRFPMRMAIILAALWPLSAIVFAAGLPLALVIPATIVGGGAVALFDVLWMTALSERIPPDRLSRVSSFDWTMSVGLLPLGYIVAGPLAESIGAVEVMVGGSALASVALTLALLPRETRMLERLESPVVKRPVTTDLPRLPNP